MDLEKDQQIKNDLILKINNFINKVNSENYEDEFLKELLAEDKRKDILDITLTECHVIDCIERNPLINAIGISQKMNITKGGISKIAAKLLKKKLINTYRLEGNKKEVFYSLTPRGKEVFLIHEQLHKKAYEKIGLLLDHYTAPELKRISDFLSELSEIV